MTKMLNTLEAAYNRLLQFLIGAVAISIGLYAILIPANLLLIKMQLGSLWWLNEAIEYALYVGVFIGAPWVLQQGAHVRVDVLVSAVSDETAKKIDRVLNLIGAFLCVLLFYYGTRAAIWEFEDGTLPDKNLRIANWYMLAVFAGSFFLLMLEFLFRLRPVRVIANTDDVSSKQAAF